MMNRYKVMVGDASGKAWINDTQVTVGDDVQMKEEQAKYLLLAGIIDFHPLDHDRSGQLGGAVRLPSIRDVTVVPEPSPTPPATPEPAKQTAEVKQTQKPKGSEK